MKSKLFKLNTRDLVNGLIVSGGTALLTSLSIAFSSGELTVKSILYPTIAALLAYLAKNLFTNSSGEVLKNDTL